MEPEAVVATSAARVNRLPARDRALDYVKNQILSGAFAGGELISEGRGRRCLGAVAYPRQGGISSPGG